MEQCHAASSQCLRGRLLACSRQPLPGGVAPLAAGGVRNGLRCIAPWGIGELNMYI
jgi:hypothetical protein